MEDKSNEATLQRPEGDRMLYASMIDADLNKLIEQLRNEPAWSTSDRDSITIFKSDRLRIVLIGLHQGAELKTHKVNSTISVQILEGSIKFITEKQTAELNAGQLLVLQENFEHNVIALKESFFLLTLAVVE